MSRIGRDVMSILNQAAPNPDISVPADGRITEAHIAYDDTLPFNRFAKVATIKVMHVESYRSAVKIWQQNNQMNETMHLPLPLPNQHDFSLALPGASVRWKDHKIFINMMSIESNMKEGPGPAVRVGFKRRSPGSELKGEVPDGDTTMWGPVGKEIYDVFWVATVDIQGFPEAVSQAGDSIALAAAPDLWERIGGNV